MITMSAASTPSITGRIGAPSGQARYAWIGAKAI